jgi:hypothetical protein
LPPKRLRFKPAKAWGSLFMSLSLSLAAYGLGTRLFGTLSLVFYLLLGWPLYPLFGITGGKDYGTPTSHCWSAAPFRNGRRPLFPGACMPLIRHSNLGLAAMLLALFLAAIQFSPARVLCVYGQPYLVINAWQATALLQLRFPDLVHHYPTLIHLALWRVAINARSNGLQGIQPLTLHQPKNSRRQGLQVAPAPRRSTDHLPLVRTPK